MHYLMYKDNVVLEIETCIIYNKHNLPFALRYIDTIKLKEGLDNWLNDRALALTRVNANKIYKSAGVKFGNYLELLYKTYGLSINDSFWIKSDREKKLKFSDKEMFNSRLDSNMYNVAMLGSDQDFTEGLVSAEFTGQGNYQKCFVKEKDGIYMYKHSSDKKIENEIVASAIAHKLGLRSASYTDALYKNIRCTKSKIIHTDDINWETAASLIECFNYTHLDGCNSPQDYAIKHFTEDICNMAIFDAIVLNDDRHMKNWSFEINGYTKSITGLAPSYDYNGTFEALPGTQSLLIFDENKRVGILTAARIAYRNYGTTLDFNNLVNYLDSHNLRINKQAMKNRIKYITGEKSNQRDCYETSILY